MHGNHAGMEEILARFLQVELRIVRFDPVVSKVNFHDDFADPVTVVFLEQTIKH